MTASEVDPTCARCGGERVNVRVAGGYGELTAGAFDRQDRAKGLKGVVGVSGVACTSCGLIELYATDPHRLHGPE
jgi:hypothetical protein